MAVSPECIAAVKKASGDTLSDAEAETMIRHFEERRATAEGAGLAHDVEARLMAGATELAEQLRIQAILARKQAILSAATFDRAMALTAQHVESKRLSYYESVRALHEGTQAGIASARVSTMTAKMGYHRGWMGEVIGNIDRDVDRWWVLARNQEFGKDVVREMFNINRTEGKAGATGNRDAAIVARHFVDIAEKIRIRLNQLGAAIGKHEGWAGPQRHNDNKVRDFGRANWVNYIFDRLDRERTFPEASGEAEVKDRLGWIWDNITTGKLPDYKDAKVAGIKMPSNVAKSLGESRVLHFASPDHWIEYNDKFGDGTIFNAMNDYIRVASSKAGLMHVLGPNPRSNWERLLIQFEREARRDPNLTPLERERQGNLIAAARGTHPAGQVENAMREAEDLTIIPVNAQLANITGNIRIIQALGKLGNMLISSLGDLVTSGINMRFQGKPLLSSYGETIAGLFQGRGKGQAREFMFQTGEGFDGLIDSLISPFATTDLSNFGWMNYAQRLHYRLTGIVGWTDALKGTQLRMLGEWMGRHSDTAWNDLDQTYRHILNRHGITPKEWDLVRSTARLSDNGNRYVSPHYIQQLTDAQMMPLAGERLAEVRAGRASREMGRLQASAVEDARIRTRVQGFRDDLARANQQLIEFRDLAKNRASDTVALLEARRDAIQARVDAAHELQTLRVGVGGLETQEALRQLLEGVEDGRLATVAGEKAGRRTEISVTASYKKGEAIGQRIGKTDARIADLEKRAAAAPEEADARIAAAEAAMTERFKSRQDDIEAFISDVRERQAERARASALETAAAPKAEADVIDRVRQELTLKLRAFYADEVRNGVLEPDAKTRRWLFQGTRPGTITGEIARAIGTFKGFPAAFVDRVILRQLHGQSGETRPERIGQAVASIVEMQVLLLIAGYGSLTAKSMLRGYSAPDPTSPKTWFASLLQGGGAGLYGDYLFGESSRFGNTPLESAFGPQIGEAASFANLLLRMRNGDAKAADLFNFGMRNAPFVNLPYIKPGLDWGILNSAREYLSPGFLHRQDEDRRKRYNQHRWMTPQAFSLR